MSQALAEKVVQGIVRQGKPVFNGVHMRMEKDAADWAIIMGGRDRLWQLYKKSMSRAGLDPSTPLYVASGLLKAAQEDAWSREEMRSLTTDIVESQVCSNTGPLQARRVHFRRVVHLHVYQHGAAGRLLASRDTTSRESDFTRYSIAYLDFYCGIA